MQAKGKPIYQQSIFHRKFRKYSRVVIDMSIKIEKHITESSKICFNIAFICAERKQIRQDPLFLQINLLLAFIHSCLSDGNLKGLLINAANQINCQAASQQQEINRSR
ncbi:hypothetical protein TTHERM_00808020 (macronuclear) [Tetrahymena thermophila SB210]|uniref:Uncharacterized protein n=1 Tax=Tetrahymena thermophila (strain SB210) TaxID=312017 RepID=Q233S1_TETTS|nr:hypothetical protein TTHERM_00808020 [Tetrahymena thermophila SB210]EAR91758.2 hypothetical protein TTHERM_00808020 [Tetrahymena thermophila SB210]|eukprot:XP_001012003.2 hypothetical protein TTHERM_00808020 [Tetrahymena thermophila SB210]